MAGYLEYKRVDLLVDLRDKPKVAKKVVLRVALMAVLLVDMMADSWVEMTAALLVETWAALMVVLMVVTMADHSVHQSVDLSAGA